MSECPSDLQPGKQARNGKCIKPSGSGMEFMLEVGEKLALFIYFGHEAGGIPAPFPPCIRKCSPATGEPGKSLLLLYYVDSHVFVASSWAS